MEQKKSLFPSANTTQPTLFPSTSVPTAALFPSVPAALFPSAPAALFPATTLPPPTSDEPQGWLRNSSFPDDLVSVANSVVPSAPRLVTLNAPPPAKKNKRRKTDDDRKKKKKKKEKKEQELITPFDIFELHTKPEKDNYRYGSLYSYDIPNYKTHIKWCVGAGKQEMTAAVARSKQKPDSSSDPNLR
eukprot:sb/3471242/